MKNRNLTLLTDYYELTMMYGYFKKQMTKTRSVFDLFFRANSESNYCIAAGLEQAVQYIENLRFEKEQLDYLRSTKDFDEDFLAYLENFRFSGDIYALEEGTVVFPGEPLMIVKAPIIEAQLMESALLNIVNFQTLIATKASRVAYVAQPGQVSEFGLRRAQAPDAAVYGARAALIGGCSSTSNVLAAQMCDTFATGTHAHSWIMAFDSELEAFRAYAEIYPDSCLLLVDTYDTLRGVKNAITVFKEMRAKGLKPKGIRLDSGDLAYLSKKAREMLDEAGFEDAMIFASGDLDEYTIQSLKLQGARIDCYGVGTKLITSHSNPSLGGVYKICEVEENGVMTPKMKISDNPAKVTNPGEKRIFRLVSKNNNKAIADVICLADEKIDESKPYTLIHPEYRWKTKEVRNFRAKELYRQIYKDGKLVYDLPDLKTIQRRKRESFDEFWDEYKRLEKPHIYKVDLSEKLYNLKQKLIDELVGKRVSNYEFQKSKKGLRPRSGRSVYQIERGTEQFHYRKSTENYRRAGRRNKTVKTGKGNGDGGRRNAYGRVAPRGGAQKVRYFFPHGGFV